VSGAYAERIVCLTEETTETLYLLGEDWRIVGISGFTVRPAAARREKPKVSAFTSARIDRILKLEPDLVLGFSDMQADIAAALVRSGIAVHIFNHRTVEGIFRMIRMLGGLIGEQQKAAGYAAELERSLFELQNAQAIVLPYDGVNPLPPQYCYLKPHYLDVQTSYFDHLESGAL